MNQDNERSTVNYTDMKLPELKILAKEKQIKGFSTMKKADLVTALEALDKPAESVSFIEGIKAAIQHAREVRSNRGRNASKLSHSAEPKSWPVKDLAFRLQRGSEHARLTPAQARRLRKAQRKTNAVELTYI